MWRASPFPYVRLSGSVRLSGPFLGLLCLLVFGVSAFTSHASFRYQLQSTRRSEACRMCFGDECWSLETARCRYYAEADEALEKNEAGGSDGSEVDELVHDMVAQASSSSWAYQECLPFISYRTDCSKENICVGCKSCSCNALGRWRCSSVQRCRPDPGLDVDHRVLLSVADNLKNDKTVRRKRSAFENRTDIPQKPPHKMSYAEIAEWMYEIKPDLGLENTSHGSNEMNTNRRIESSTFKVDTDAEYIAFDEVLKNIETENQNIIRRKPQLKETTYDYMDLDDVVVVKNNDTDQFVSMLNDFVDGNENPVTDPTVKESTKIVIDVVASLKKDYIDNNNSINHDENEADNVNDKITFDAIHIMKRDVSSVAKSYTTTEVPDNVDNATTVKPVTGLKNNVLTPLNKIIDDKQQELKDLVKIKENLIQFIMKIKDFNDTNLDLNSKSQEVLNSSNTVLSIYNLDIFPEIQFDLRKINPNVLDKWLYKLKRDIYEVIKDVVGIKKISSTNKLPEDLKTLIRAMSFYVRKQADIAITRRTGDQRRNQNDKYPDMNSTKDYLINIFEIIDKYMSQSDALLSQGTRKILKRVIKTFYSDDYSAIGSRVYNPDYNLTNDLRCIGSNWKPMTANIAASAPADKIYALKLLHFTLLSDVNKLNDALALIDYAQNRRMIPIEADLGDELLDKINNDLIEINEKIKLIIMYKMSRKNIVKTKSNKKISFLKKIRNLLKGSEKDIGELVNKKVPRSEIVKTIAKKRLDELAEKKIYEYQDTMRKWQNTLNVIPRYKRSLDLNKIKDRSIKNIIIPKYLQGKLNPAIMEKRTKRNHAQKIIAGKKNTFGAKTMRRELTSAKSKKEDVIKKPTNKIIKTKPKNIPKSANNSKH